MHTYKHAPTHAYTMTQRKKGKFYSIFNCHIDYLGGRKAITTPPWKYTHVDTQIHFIKYKKIKNREREREREREEREREREREREKQYLLRQKFVTDN